MRREKAVYDTLNMLNFDVTKKCLVGEGWCPIFAKTKVLLLCMLMFVCVNNWSIPCCITFIEVDKNSDILQIQEALQRATYDSNSQAGIIFHVKDSVEPPPTYFRTNNLTSAYQEIVDAYG